MSYYPLLSQHRLLRFETQLTRLARKLRIREMEKYLNVLGVWDVINESCNSYEGTLYRAGLYHGLVDDKRAFVVV